MPINCRCSASNYQMPIFTKHTRTLKLRRTLHSSEGVRRRKQYDDEPDLNLDFEHEVMWIQEKFTNTSSQPSTRTSSGEMHNEALHKQWLFDSLPEMTSLQKSPVKYDCKTWSKKVLHPYRGNHIAEFQTGKPAPRLTPDVAVELLTCELKDLFGYDRSAAYKVASCVRKSCCLAEDEGFPLYPAITNTDLAGTRKIVGDAMATAHVIVEEGITKDVLYKVPQIIRVPAYCIRERLGLLRDAKMYPEATPFILLSVPFLEKAILQCQVEAKLLPHHSDRLHFLADAFQMDVQTLACLAANEGLHRFLGVDLAYWAAMLDVCNFYRVSAKTLRDNFGLLFRFRRSLVERFDTFARMHNPPEVLAALARVNLSKAFIHDRFGNWQEEQTQSIPIKWAAPRNRSHKSVAADLAMVSSKYLGGVGAGEDAPRAPSAPNSQQNDAALLMSYVIPDRVAFYCGVASDSYLRSKQKQNKGNWPPSSLGS